MESSSFGLKTLSSAINEYLKKVEDRTERNLLKQFKERYSGFRVKDVRHELFDEFLKSLSVSEASLRSYRSRLKRFKAHIGLSEKKVKDNPKRTDKEYRQLERKLAEKEEAVILHEKTIDEERAKYNAEIQKLHETIDMLKSKGLEMKDLDNLAEKKAQLQTEIETMRTEWDKEKAKAKETIENQRIFEVDCPLGKGLVSLGNECHTCMDYVNCPLSSRRPDLLHVK